jgi:hypothetical protein
MALHGNTYFFRLSCGNIAVSAAVVKVADIFL